MHLQIFRLEIDRDETQQALAMAERSIRYVGLAMTVFMSLLPAGIYQAWASVSQACGSPARRRSCTRR
jgi:nitric oxide reductase large subunit